MTINKRKEESMEAAARASSTHADGDGALANSAPSIPTDEGIIKKWKELWQEERKLNYTIGIEPQVAIRLYREAYEKGIADGIAEEGLNCDRHCQEARAKGRQEGIDAVEKELKRTPFNHDRIADEEAIRRARKR